MGKTGTSKRKPVDSGDTAAQARLPNQAAGSASSPSAFTHSMLESNTPAGMCAGSRGEQKCKRISCKYDHKTRHPIVPFSPPGAPSCTDFGADGNAYASDDSRRDQRHPSQPTPPPLLPPRHPSRASAATTGAGATEQEAAAPEGTGLVLQRG